MSIGPKPPRQSRLPDAASEARLLELRREAEQRGMVTSAGAKPAGAPFPQASPEAGYYGMPLLKKPGWSWEVPVYFFVGGAAGAAAVIGAMANWTGADKRLVRDARWVASLGGPISTGLLISDLGRPARFLNMLRVFKVQSPMSVGAWTLSAFASASAASAFAEAVDRRFGGLMPVRVLGNAAEALAASTGVVMSSYTGVLIGATVIPVWNENVRTLPLHFAASGVGSAVSVLELMGHDDSTALNTLGIGAAAYEAYEGLHIETHPTAANEPLRAGVSGWVTRSGGVLSGPVPLLLRLAALSTRGETARNFRRAAAMSTLVGSFITRVAWIMAGHASSKDYRLPLERGGAKQRQELPPRSRQQEKELLPRERPDKPHGISK
ncbi:MAG: polysulfide reductase NrfD [Candidatus Koribacter versatilis]|uniref:Polysulfide reductase NrfD n=1 Tax=Candidatus Korobacter versatilis TaxID=658062 RepID=A0A932ENQ1_9BACT|nr:polysulfide reductase NrfD [Candidatus Koribacter versatilis]